GPPRGLTASRGGGGGGGGGGAGGAGGGGGGGGLSADLSAARATGSPVSRARHPLPASGERVPRGRAMSNLEETLSWPFFNDGHRRFAETLARWADATLAALPHEDLDAACRARGKALGEGGFLKAVVPAEPRGLQ